MIKLTSLQAPKKHNDRAAPNGNDKVSLQRNQRGFLLVTVLVISIILTIIGFALLSGETDQYVLSSNSTYSVNALYVAEAGIEQSIHQLNQDDTFTGYSSPQTFFNNTTQGDGAYTTTVADISGGNAKTITSVGKIYRGNSTTPVSQRTVKVTAVGTSSSNYSVQTGPGGLSLGGSANITNANVYVNGTLSLSGASKIGTAQTPVTVDVANDACPTGTSPGATYPAVCTGSTQPISLAYSTNIYGTVCATGQTSTGPNNNIQGGSSGQGLQSGCTAPVVSTPTYDRSTQIAAVTTTAAGTSNTYTCQSWPFNRTWPANLELTGNVDIGGSCNVDIKGNAYITGNLSIDGASTSTVDDAVGTNRPVVIVDGTITVGGSAALVANSSGTGIEFISFKSAASCGSACTGLTGNDLYNSQKQTTVNIGGAVNLPGMIFDAYWGKLVLGGSGHVGAVAGQNIDMSGAGTVVFGTTLSSGTQTWTITSYQQVY
jgi:Tfp pilus assembly protein PilX